MALAHFPRVFFGERAMPDNRGPRGLVTLVCLTCGNEKFFDEAVPSSVKCDKCGSTVFRQFATPTEPDEATIDQLEAQARSVSYGDASPETTPDEVRDLDQF
jgi:ribosomal protein S27E